MEWNELYHGINLSTIAHKYKDLCWHNEAAKHPGEGGGWRGFRVVSSSLMFTQTSSLLRNSVPILNSHRVYSWMTRKSHHVHTLGHVHNVKRHNIIWIWTAEINGNAASWVYCVSSRWHVLAYDCNYDLCRCRGSDEGWETWLQYIQTRDTNLFSNACEAASFPTLVDWIDDPIDSRIPANLR